MGLDMYLSARRSLSVWQPDEKQLKAAIDAALNTELGTVSHVTIDVGYWRKANAIHNWFVKTVQDGVDECQEYTVSLEQLTELLAIVNMVIDDPTLAGEILPPREGFFFGSTTVDDWYNEYLVHTKEILEKILDNPDSKNWEFFYQSSW
jgi:hypothetical protein